MDTLNVIANKMLYFGTYCMCLILELFMFSFPNIYNYNACNMFLIYNVVKLTSYVFTHYLFSIIIFCIFENIYDRTKFNLEYYQIIL